MRQKISTQNDASSIGRGKYQNRHDRDSVTMQAQFIIYAYKRGEAWAQYYAYHLVYFETVQESFLGHNLTTVIRQGNIVVSKVFL